MTSSLLRHGAKHRERIRAAASSPIIDVTAFVRAGYSPEELARAHQGRVIYVRDEQRPNERKARKWFDWRP